MRSEVSSPGLSRFLIFVGFRYWTASLLPALAGTTLPFWLLSSGFSFRWLAALEFLVGTLLIQAGFSLLHAWFQDRSRLDIPGSGSSGISVVASQIWTSFQKLPKNPGAWPLRISGLCIVTGCLLGLHLNRGLPLHDGVPRYIFIVYGLATLMAGTLYVAPPFSFWRRAGGEVVLSEGLGLLPLLGAYLVQVGDISRTVYLASLPIVVATGLWIWMDELITRDLDWKHQRLTMVTLFGLRIAAQYGTAALSVLFYATLFVAVLSASLGPLALTAIFLIGLVRRILMSSWKDYNFPSQLQTARELAFRVHLFTGFIMILSSLVPLGF